LKDPVLKKVISKRQTKMKKRDVQERIKGFEEVALGYSEEEAVEEAKRCLDCKKPLCVSGCPVEINIPGFIKAIKKRDYKGSLRVLKEKNSLPAVCGRVCPQEDQCEKACILNKKGNPINIGALERFAADHGKETGKTDTYPSKARRKTHEARRSKVAVIGAGPSGLTCAADLAKMGYKVTVFESLHEAGGVLVYGIPDFRLPGSIMEEEVGFIRSLGVEIKLNTVVGKSVSIEKLRKDGYRSFFIGTGAGLPYFLGIEGENLNGVYSANEFLTRVNLMKAYMFPEYDTPVRIGNNIAVIGAGNVAMDSARCAKRLGAKNVTIIYRRTEKEMPARREEIENAKEEGIKFELLTSPLKIFGTDDGWVRSMECQRNKLGDPDSSGRRRPVPIEGEILNIGVDTVICAIGQGPNPLLISTMPELKKNKKGAIDANVETGATSMEDVFAGGDIVTGAATVIQAMGAGKRAARTIDGYIKSKYGN